MSVLSRRRQLKLAVLVGATSGALLFAGCATLDRTTSAAATAPSAAAADAPSNFGFPLGFSPSKMDTEADPRQDFRRYAAGRWLDAASIPADKLEISGYLVMSEVVQSQLRRLLQDAARDSRSAMPGSAEQLVGDFYASGMDVERRRALGMQPLAEEMARIDAAQTRTALSAQMARLQLSTGNGAPLLATVSRHPADRTRHVIYVGEADLGLPDANYLTPDAERIREAYRAKVTAQLQLAGWPQAAASETAARLLADETRVAKKKLTPLERRDPAKRFVPMAYADLQKLLPAIDVDAFFSTLGLPTQGEIIVVGVDALRERNAIMAEQTAEQTRAQLKLALLRQLKPFLTPALDEPDAAFSRVLYGKDITPPLERQVADAVPGLLGHPLSQLYVRRYMAPETRSQVEAMVASVKAQFRARIERNAWLSASTRTQALAKLDKTQIRVGYPDRWIDFTGVQIRRDDYVGNAMRLNEFLSRREIAKLGKPVELDQFATPNSTLPIVINAAYDPSWNGIEIPAAFLQPPFFDPKADAAVNFCTMGAVIGHELTHGFDSSGRQYDSDGNVRDWWTADDAQRFNAEVRKLAAQAEAFEILPGLRLNGPVEVTENLADAGGLALGYAALKDHLRRTPAADRVIDGQTPQQRCFLAWAQLWASKMNEGAMRQLLPVDGHPPGLYRMAAPAQHEPGFHEAFGIRPGDRMWLDPSRRVSIW